MKQQSDDQDEGHDHYRHKSWQSSLIHQLKMVSARVKYKFEHPEILKEFPLD